MSLMDWNERFDIGVDAMNHEHQGLLDAMNALHDADKAGVTGPEINRLVAELGRLSAEHFAHEERYMETIGYEGLKTHKIIHQDLLRKYGDFAEKIRAEGGKAEPAFFTFLKLWLSAHIMGIDMKYGPKAGADAA